MLPAKRTLVVALAAWFLLAVGPAFAQWRVQQGIDISSGGPSILLIGKFDDRNSFYASCIAGVTRLFVESFDGKDDALTGSGRIDVGITLDQLNDSLWWTTGQQARRPGYITSNLTDPAVFARALRDIAAAKQSITVSLYLQDTRTMSDLTISAAGSTAAVREFGALCAAQSPGTPAVEPPLSPTPEPIPAPEPAQPGGQVPVQGGGWSFVPGTQPELLSPIANDMQVIIACVAKATGILFIESTDLAGFPPIRSSSDGVAVFGFDQLEPVRIAVAPGQARPGVVSAIAENPADAAVVIDLLAAEPPFEQMAMLFANRNSDARKLAVYPLAGAASAAAAFRTACNN